MATYSVWKAYAVWLVGGIVGWHYIYLDEDREAVYYGQLLGTSGLSWVLDFFSLYGMVKRANQGTLHAGDVNKKGKAAFQWSRLTKAFILAFIYARLAACFFAWTDEDVRREEDPTLREVGLAVTALAAAIGAVFIGRMGLQTTSFFGALAAAYGCARLLLHSPDSEWTTHTVAAGAAAVAAAYFRSLRPGTVEAIPASEAKSAGKSPAEQPRKAIKGGVIPAAEPTYRVAPPAPRKKKGCCGRTWRLLRIGAAVGVFWLAGLSALILQSEQNVDEHGNQSKEGLHRMKTGVYLYRNRETIRNSVVELWGELRRYIDTNGWEGLKRDITDHVWKEDEYAVLGLSEGATLAEVKTAHRRMVRELHPDRLPAGLGEAERTAAINKFRKVQQAYEELNRKLGDGRGRKGRRSSGDDEL